MVHDFLGPDQPTEQSGSAVMSSCAETMVATRAEAIAKNPYLILILFVVEEREELEGNGGLRSG